MLTSEAASGTCDVDPSQLAAITTVWDWLDQVNATNFAGHNDWSLPSEGGQNAPFTGSQELKTLLRLPCSPGSCIDQLLGFVPARVTSNGRFATQGALPADAGNYQRIVVTSERITPGTKRPPSRPGTVVLQGTLKLG